MWPVNWQQLCGKGKRGGSLRGPGHSDEERQAEGAPWETAWANSHNNTSTRAPVFEWNQAGRKEEIRTKVICQQTPWNPALRSREGNFSRENFEGAKPMIKVGKIKKRVKTLTMWKADSVGELTVPVCCRKENEGKRTRQVKKEKRKSLKACSV